jgi:hypothetical protein
MEQLSRRGFLKAIAGAAALTVVPPIIRPKPEPEALSWGLLEYLSEPRSEGEIVIWQERTRVLARIGDRVIAIAEEPEDHSRVFNAAIRARDETGGGIVTVDGGRYYLDREPVRFGMLGDYESGVSRTRLAGVGEGSCLYGPNFSAVMYDGGLHPVRNPWPGARSYILTPASELAVRVGGPPA